MTIGIFSISSPTLIFEWGTIVNYRKGTIEKYEKWQTEREVTFSFMGSRNPFKIANTGNRI